MRQLTFVFCIAVSVFSFSTSRADLIMKITADDTLLAVGDTTTLRVFGWAEEATGTNGLYDWSVSAFVDMAGIVKVNSATVLQPVPVDTGSVIVSKNFGGLGNVDAAAAIQFSAMGSTAGIGYTELFNFQIEAVTEGDVQYALRNIVGDLFDFSVMYDDRVYFNVEFDEQNSAGAIRVVPEPSSMLLLSGLSAAGLLRRKRR